MSDTSLVFNVLAKDKATEVFKGIGSGIDKFSALVVGGAVAGGLALAKMGDVFDSAFDTIRVGTGKMGPELDGLKGDFRAVFASVPTDAATAADALTAVAKTTGLAGPPLQHLTEQFINLARVTGVDLPSSVTSITRVFGDWSIATDQQATAMDKLFRASQTSGVGVLSLADTLVQFGAPLRQLGFSFDESVAMLSKWQKEGVNTELVLGGLKKALGAAAKAGQDPVRELDKLTLSIKNAGSTAAANKLAVEALGVKAGPDFAAAVREGRFEYQDMLKAITTGTDTINGAAEDTADFAEKLTLLKNKGMLALEPVAMRVFDMLGVGSGRLEELATWTQRNADTLAPFAITLGGLVGTIVLLNYAMKAWTVITGVATAVQLALDSAVFAFPGTWIVLAVVAIVAAVYLLWTRSAGFRDFFIGLWDHIWGFLKAVGAWFAGPFVGFFVAAGRGIADAAMWVWHNVLVPFVNFFVGAGEAIAAPFIWLWKDVLTPFGHGVGVVFLSVGNFVKSLINLWLFLTHMVIKLTWETVIRPTLNSIGDAAMFLWRNVFVPVGNGIAWVAGQIGDAAMWLWRTVFVPVGNGIGFVVGKVGDAASWLWSNAIRPAFHGIADAALWVWSIVSFSFDLISGKAHAVADVFRSVFSAVGGFISSAFSTAVGTVKGVINGTIRMLNTALGWINSRVIDVANQVPGVSFGHIPTIPMLAKGGDITRSGLAIVGDKGPELVNLNAGAQVRPLSPNGGGNGGGGSATLVVEGGGGRADDAFLWQLRRAIRNVGGSPSALGLKIPVTAGGRR